MATFTLKWDVYNAISFSCLTLWLLAEVIPVGTAPLEVSPTYKVPSEEENVIYKLFYRSF